MDGAHVRQNVRETSMNGRIGRQLFESYDAIHHAREELSNSGRCHARRALINYSI